MALQVKLAEKDSDFKLENIMLSENCTQDRTSDLSPRHERFIFNYNSKFNVRAPWGKGEIQITASSKLTLYLFQYFLRCWTAFHDPLSWRSILATAGIAGPGKLLNNSSSWRPSYMNNFLLGEPSVVNTAIDLGLQAALPVDCRDQSCHVTWAWVEHKGKLIIPIFIIRWIYCSHLIKTYHISLSH